MNKLKNTKPYQGWFQKTVNEEWWGDVPFSQRKSREREKQAIVISIKASNCCKAGLWKNNPLIDTACAPVSTS